MTTAVRILLALCLATVVAACATTGGESSMPGDNADTITVTGALAYRERIALAPNSSARITISDIAIADRKAPVVAEKTIDFGRRQVPIKFKLSLAKDRLRSRGRYSLRATIRDPAGKLTWTTDSAHVIDTAKAVNDLGPLRLVQASAQSENDHSPLGGPEWVVENIAAGGIIDYSRVTLNFDADGKLYGRASCNRYSGSYEINGQQLDVGTLAVTRMACAPALDNQEHKFLQVLQHARSFTFDATGKLIIRSESGKALEAYPAG